MSGVEPPGAERATTKHGSAPADDDLRALHEHETAHRGRPTVLRAIERLQRWEPNS